MFVCQLFRPVFLKVYLISSVGGASFPNSLSTSPQKIIIKPMDHSSGDEKGIALMRSARVLSRLRHQPASSRWHFPAWGWGLPLSAVHYVGSRCMLRHLLFVFHCVLFSVFASSIVLCVERVKSNVLADFHSRHFYSIALTAAAAFHFLGRGGRITHGDSGHRTIWPNNGRVPRPLT